MSLIYLERHFQYSPIIVYMATLKDIAEKTGLSMNTVSRAIRGRGYVSQKAADLVKEAVRELGYHPNFAAQSLRLQKSMELAVIMCSSDYLNIRRLMGVRDYSFDHGYRTTVHFTHPIDDGDNFDDLISAIMKQSPAGVVVIAPSSKHLKKMRQLRTIIPCVAASYHEEESVDCVYVDRYSGVYNAIQYLYRHGRKRIVFGETTGAQNRKDGYLRAVRDLGLPELIIKVVSSDHEEIRRGGLKAAEEISKWKELPDAIQTSDYLACGLLAGFSRLGIRVPEDIAIIGFDDREIAEMSTPPLTTIAHPGEAVGAACAKMLIERIDSGFCSDAMPQSVKIPMKLVIRKST